MVEDSRQRGDVLLPPNEFVWAIDESKNASILTYVGALKLNFSATEQPVVFNVKTKRFDPVQLTQARQLFATAPEGWYIVLKNPTKLKKKETSIQSLAHPLA